MKIIKFILFTAIVNYIKITAANKKQLESLLKKKSDDLGFLVVLLIVISILAILGLLLIF